ncbi:uncharacterized protein JN550_008097 [Neoarthrinium moseri]|uniref:uncharacterized protein n=1 Tax=Neoarthrinium moseri TaxID=1658444 RepID=UPI001FDCAEC1|nr:uncharacterized protein JN550_008097 [Neoarthrinium moseri]KAI1865839.1 hypothetical protein JN550_008097 [Neoarthrinium moseri]
MAATRYSQVDGPTSGGHTNQVKLTRKPQIAAEHLRRPYLRATIGALAPLAITVYFWVIWRLVLNTPTASNCLIFGQPGGNAIYYSWFVIATLGLSISQYGLESVQLDSLSASQYQSYTTGRKDRTWARPDGWLRVIRYRIFHRKKHSAHMSLKLWSSLAITTMFGFIGLPLSGLAMNFGNGYYSSEANPLTTGFNNDSWNSRFKAGISQRAFVDWNNGAPLSLPESGVIYSSPDLDRSSVSYLASLPNTLPNDTGVADLFLAPQALHPIDGSSWGLRFGYNCTVVTKLADFTILNHRQNRNGSSGVGSSTYTVNEGNAIIRVWNETDTSVRVHFANNIQAVAEIGWDEANKNQQQTRSAPAASECYNPIPLSRDESIPYPGLAQPQVLEFALWQNLTSTNFDVENPPTIDQSLPNTIPELFGARHTYDQDGAETQNPMAAIGVRCTSVSEVGTARVDGRLSTFAEFHRSDSTPKGTSGLRCAERLSLGVPNLLFANALASSSPSEWLSPSYSSVGKYQQEYTQQDYMWVGNKINLQSSYLQAEELKRSLIRAYSLYALALVYNSGVGYISGNGTYVSDSFVNVDAVTYVEDTILMPGVVPPVVIAALLTFWASGSLILCALYGFRRR